MARRRQHEDSSPLHRTPHAALCHRAWRCRRRGDERRAMLLLREAAYGHEQDARLWVLYAVQCTRVGRSDAANQALTHAAWLRERNGEFAKARVTRALLARLDAERAA